MAVSSGAIRSLLGWIPNGQPDRGPRQCGVAPLPGTATNGGTDALWFTSGINHEQNGLLGVLRP
jgi:hypothetical protein